MLNTVPNRAYALARKAQQAQRTRSSSASLPAPVGGWNARDALGAMAADDAVELINYFPKTTTVALRDGFLPWSTGLIGQVETVMGYSGGATNKLFAATDAGYIYNNTTADSILTDESGAYIITETGDSLVVTTQGSILNLSGLSNGRWQYVNFTTSGGSYLNIVNGADYYHIFDGTSWHQDTDGAPYDITGVDSRTLIGINNFKNRLWFVQTGTLKAWYLPVNSIGGAAAALDMSSLCQRGGYLMAMGTWTIDAGYGVDDYAVWITSNGEVLVWRMTDPTDANSIFLIGVWWIGSPIGRRCMVKYKGDLLVITQEGLFPLSAALQSSRLNPRVALTDKIQAAVSEAVATYGTNYGWQVLPFPKANMLILNVPIQEGQSQEQYVMNTITGSWGRFQGWDANCWELYNDDIYFGGNTLVGNAWTGQADNGVAIDGSILQAFNYFGKRGTLKRFTMMRPVLYSNGAPSIQGNINIDFDMSAPTPNLNTIPSSGAIWDSGVWDQGLWGSDTSVINRWQSTTGVGYCGAPRFASSTNAFSIELVSTDVVMQEGAIL